MNNLNCQASVDAIAPVNAQNIQNEVSTINIEQLQDDLQFEASLLDEVPEDVLQKDNRGNVCDPPSISYSTDYEEFIDAKTGKPCNPSHADIIEALKRRFNLCRILGDVCLYDITKRQYVFGKEAFEDMIVRYIYKDATSKLRNEAYMLAKLPSMLEDREEAPAYYLHFANCIVDASTMKIYKPSPLFYIVNNIPYDYNPNAKSKLFDDFLSSVACDREEVIRSLHEMLALIMYRSYPSAIVKLYNTDRRENASGGKTTAAECFAHMVTGASLLNSPNYTMLTDNQFSSKFNRANLGITLYNYSDENEQPESRYRSTVASFKKNAATGASFQADVKGVQKNTYTTPRCLFVDSCNELGRQEHDDGTERRIFYIPFNAHFSPNDDNFDPHLREKLNTLEVWQTMANYAIATLHEMSERGVYEFTDTEDNRRAKQAARENDLAILAWMSECNLTNAVLTYRGYLNPFACVEGESLRAELVKIFGANNLSNARDRLASLDRQRIMTNADWKNFFSVWCKVNKAGDGFRLWKTDLENKLHLFVHKAQVTIDNEQKTKSMLAFKDAAGNYQYAAEVLDRYGNLLRGENAIADYKELLPFISKEQAEAIKAEIEKAGYTIPADEDEKEVLTSENEEVTTPDDKAEIAANFSPLFMI